MTIRNCLIISALTFVICSNCTSQTTVSLDEKIAFWISDHWRGYAELKGAIDCKKESAGWYSVSLGGGFNLYEGIYVVGVGSVSNSHYFHLDNKDLIWTLSEGVHFETKSHFTHRIFFEERNLRYRPSKVKVNATRLFYELQKDFIIQNVWIIGANAAVVVNIRSDVSGGDFLQRVKVGVSLSRQLSENSNIGLHYKYHCCGKSQSYMGDYHNLHSVAIIFKFRNF